MVVLEHELADGFGCWDGHGRASRSGRGTESNSHDPELESSPPATLPLKEVGNSHGRPTRYPHTGDSAAIPFEIRSQQAPADQHEQILNHSDSSLPQQLLRASSVRLRVSVVNSRKGGGGEGLSRSPLF
jgi:hypothetical protein